MNGTKCRNCGVVNLDADTACRRCGERLVPTFVPQRTELGPREAAKRSSPLYTLLILALLGGGIYYLYSGVQKSYEEIRSKEAKHTATPGNHPAEPFKSRSDTEQKRVEPYKNALQNSQSFVESNKRLSETHKLMQTASGNTKK